MALDTITNSHIPLAALQRLPTFYSLQTSISILASNNNFYTHHRYPPQLRSYIILVQYFQPLAHPNLPSDNHPLFHLVWATSVELLRVRETVDCWELWGGREHLRLLG